MNLLLGCVLFLIIGSSVVLSQNNGIAEDNFNIQLDVVDATKIFFSKLKGLKDPEQKRKTIGRQFIKVFEKYSKANNDIKFLAQGTLYPDVIETASQVGEKKNYY